MGGLSSDSMFMSWPQLTGFGLGLLIQNVGMQYRQPIRRVFELGPGVVPNGAGGFINAAACDGAYGPPSPTIDCSLRTQATYYIVGRPEGRLQLQRFVGPQALTCEFYRRYGSPCSSNLVQISGRAGCSATDASAKLVFWDMLGVVLDDYQAQASGQEMVMQEGLGAMFTSLKVRAQNDSSCAA
jgi:hypothetical protein